MFFLVNTYTAPLERIDELLPEHRAWVEAAFERGDLLFGGRREPRTGGFVVTPHTDLDDVQKLLRGDPLVRHGVAEWQVHGLHLQLTGSTGLQAAFEAAGLPSDLVEGSKE
ncbi:YciI family protein [Actinomadura hibisca]|uniref:YciI family protein n=1 Tax=Actinomadura hibisca TaxID=68565 RepID=UPI00082E5E0D|nr:YciI family protein [Actinomadura hibisca]